MKTVVLPSPSADTAKSVRFWARLSVMVFAAVGSQILGIWHLWVTGINLAVPRPQHSQFLSGAVCGDELVFLMDTLTDGIPTVHPPVQTHEVDEVHCNLRTGSISKSPADSDVRYVVSDGVTLWRLPSGARVYHPFVYGGQPVRLSDRDGPYHLEAFIDGTWTETDDYLLVRYGYALHGCQSVKFGVASIPIIHFVRNELSVEFNPQVAVGTKSEYIEFAKKERKLEWQESRQPPPGWKRVDFPSGTFSMWSRPSNLSDCAIGVWIENENVWALQDDYKGGRFSGFEFHRGNGIPVIYASSPLKWGPFSDSLFPKRLFWREGLIAVVPEAVDRTFIISINSDDRRIHVMEWKDRKLCLAAQSGSPFIFQKCVALEPAFRYVVLFPVILLIVIVGVIQQFDRPCYYCFAREQVMLASAVRRGLARGVDLAIPGTLFFAAVVLHPDVTGWLYELHSQWIKQIIPWFSPRTVTSALTAADLAKSLAGLYRESLSVPYLPGWAIGGLTIVIVQTVWQGRTGRTIGKSLLGLRTLRTSLRPCGVARSMLREILLILDSVFFMSWIPGVSMIMSTKNAQRLGDRVADTVVIRDGDSMHRTSTVEN